MYNNFFSHFIPLQIEHFEIVIFNLNQQTKMSRVEQLRKLWTTFIFANLRPLIFFSKWILNKYKWLWWDLNLNTFPNPEEFLRFKNKEKVEIWKVLVCKVLVNSFLSAVTFLEPQKVFEKGKILKHGWSH